MTRKWTFLGILFPMFLFLSGYILNLQFIFTGSITAELSLYREVILFCALVLFIWRCLRMEWLKKRTLVQKLWIMCGASLLLLMGVILLSLEILYIWPVILLGIIVLGMWIVVLCKEFIYVQQSKKTERNFRLLIFFIYLHMAYMIFLKSQDNAFPQSWRLWHGDSIVCSIFLVLVILFAFINGFRCKWIHYLNKRQKIGVFFFGSMAYSAIMTLIIIQFFTVAEYSLILDGFLKSVYFLLIIYMGMALLGILFQLPSAGLMDRRIREIKSLQALSTTIGSVFDTNELISKAVEISQRVVGADYTWLELKEDSDYRFAGAHGLTKIDVQRLPDSFLSSIRNELKTTESAILVNNLVKESRFKGIRKWKYKAGSILASRIRYKEKELGIVYAMKSERFGFVEENRGLFQAFADQIAVALENSHLIQVTIEQEVYREELRVAHDAQMRLLPREMPEIDGVDLDAVCITANEIGGDFYEMIMVDKDRIDFIIGDVSGKGASAAFYMAELKGVIQALAHHFTSPKKILVEVNTFIRNNFEANTFATMIYGIFSPAKKQIRYVRAGHPPLGLIRGGRVTWLESDGLGLGLTSEVKFNKATKEGVQSLKKGDKLFFYTDGLTEARNSEGEEYGEEALKELMLSMKGYSTEEMLKQIRQQMETFSTGVPRHDDITIVLLQLTK